MSGNAEIGIGSSPPTRGARRRQLHAARPVRIIPAYAGSTCLGALSSSHGPDHPRLRGEHEALGLTWDHIDGSSPPTRGALMRLSSHNNRLRIIPAYAGSTKPCAHRLPRMTDHPRLRGEHFRGFLPRPTPFGSSPPTRGAPSLPHPPREPKRIIPAYAGSTSLAASG